MTSPHISAALALVAVAAITAGVAMLAGVPWALITVGAFALIAAVVLYDPASKGDST